MRRFLALSAILWMFALPAALIAGGIANNPGSQLANEVQGPDPTGNGGYPISVVNATGTTLDTSGTVTGTVTANQGTPNAGGASAWPVSTGLSVAASNSVDGTGVAGAGLVIYDYDNVNWKFAQSVSASGSTFLGNRVLAVGGELLNVCNSRQEQMLSAAGASCGTDIGWSGQGVSVTALEGRNGGGFDMIRTANVFKTVATGAAGNTALWTPTAGKKFRLMRYMVTVTDQTTQAAPGTLTVSLFDGAAGVTGQVHDVFVPAIGLVNTGSLYTSGWIDLDNGYLSTAANNVLNINLSAALTAGTVRVICCGTEE